jgi:methionyl-tRNA formyltransferase
MNREEQPRFTLHALTPQIDDGEVIVEQMLETSSRVPNVEEARGQHDIALARVLESFFRLVDGFDVEDAVRVPDADRAYFPALSAERHGWVNWEWDGADIESFIRSFSRPYPGASTFHGQRRIRIFDAEFSASQAKRHPFAHGIVVDKMSGALVVCVRGGQLIIRGEDLAGVATNFITIGDRLFTPVEHLEEAKKFRRRHLAPPDTAG